jgi:hypothetical protein
MVDSKLNIVKREYYYMGRIPKPKPPPTQDNLKLEDFMKYNNQSIEDLIV